MIWTRGVLAAPRQAGDMRSSEPRMRAPLGACCRILAPAVAFTSSMRPMLVAFPGVPTCMHAPCQHGTESIYPYKSNTYTIRYRMLTVLSVKKPLQFSVNKLYTASKCLITLNKQLSIFFTFRCQDSLHTLDGRSCINCAKSIRLHLSPPDDRISPDLHNPACPQASCKPF